MSELPPLPNGWEARRYHPSGVTPLEVWNLLVSGRELWSVLGVPLVDQDRSEGVTGPALAWGLMPALEEALRTLVERHAPDAVWLAGGLACLDGFTNALAAITRTLPCPVFVAKEPRFASVHAGLRVLESRGAKHPLSIDVGQTSIKCESPTLLRTFDRDSSTLPPLFIGMRRPEDGSHVAATVRFIAGAMSDVARTLDGGPDALCLALPCPLDEALMPGGCTYGWEGHASLVASLLASMSPQAERGTAWVLNDAELAAEAARSDARLTNTRRVLCLTLGFGPGCALLERP